MSLINERFFIGSGFSVLGEVICVSLTQVLALCGKKGGSGPGFHERVFPPNRTVQSEKHRRGQPAMGNAAPVRSYSASSGSMPAGNGSPTPLLAWKCLRTEEPGGLPSSGSQRAGPA